MNFTTFTRGDGSISVYTTQGAPLVDGAAQTLNFSAASTIQAQMTLAGGELSGVSVSGPNITGGSTDITSQITGGEISGLLQMRDQSLPNIQSQLDTMAQTIQTGLNQISNSGVSYPDGGQSFTGQTTFLNPGSQNISLASGDTAITLFNGSGTETAGTTLSLMMKIPAVDRAAALELVDRHSGRKRTQRLADQHSVRHQQRHLCFGAAERQLLDPVAARNHRPCWSGRR